MASAFDTALAAAAASAQKRRKDAQNVSFSDPQPDPELRAVWQNMNLPNVKVDLPVLQAKDIDDLQNFAVPHKVAAPRASIISCTPHPSLLLTARSSSPLVPLGLGGVAAQVGVQPLTKRELLGEARLPKKASLASEVAREVASVVAREVTSEVACVVTCVVAREGGGKGCQK